MSVRSGFMWIAPAVVVGSWLTVRALAAPPAGPVLEDPPLPSMSVAPKPTDEIRDPGLARLIGRFAAVARSSRW
jgi:hypothetical protein